MVVGVGVSAAMVETMPLCSIGKDASYFKLLYRSGSPGCPSHFAWLAGHGVDNDFNVTSWLVIKQNVLMAESQVRCTVLNEIKFMKLLGE